MGNMLHITQLTKQRNSCIHLSEHAQRLASELVNGLRWSSYTLKTLNATSLFCCLALLYKHPRVSPDFTLLRRQGIRQVFSHLKASAKASQNHPQHIWIVFNDQNNTLKQFERVVGVCARF